jgi:hypothetical protein
MLLEGLNSRNDDEPRKSGSVGREEVLDPGLAPAGPDEQGTVSRATFLAHSAGVSPGAGLSSYQGILSSRRPGIDLGFVTEKNKPQSFRLAGHAGFSFVVLEWSSFRTSLPELARRGRRLK